MLQRVGFLAVWIVTFFTDTRASSVYGSRDSELSRCHDTTVYLASSYQNLAIRKQDGKNVLPIISTLLVEIKKRGKLSITSVAMLQHQRWKKAKDS